MSVYAFGNVIDDSGYSNSTGVLFPATPVTSKNMDVLYNNMNLPDLIDQTGTENCKAGRGEKADFEEIWGKCRNCSLPDYKIWQKNCTETERNLVMMNSISEEPRVWGLTA